MGVLVGLVWTDPLRGCALSHTDNHPVTAGHDVFFFSAFERFQLSKAVTLIILLTHVCVLSIKLHIPKQFTELSS